MQSAPTVAVPPKHIMCPITLEIMKDPVIVVSGDSYERTAIEQWFYSNNTLPLSNVVINDKTLYPNRALKIFIEGWVARNPQPISTVMDDFIPQIRQKPIPQSPRQLSLNLRGILSSAHRVLSRSSREFGTLTTLEFDLPSLTRRQSSSVIIPFGPISNTTLIEP